MKKIILLTLLFSSLVYAQEPSRKPSPSGLDSFGALTGGMSLGGPHRPALSVGGSFSPQEETSDLEQHRIHFSMPVYRDDSDSYGVSANYGSLYLNKNLTLSKGTAVPNRFERRELGFSFSRKLPEHQSLGLRFSLGTATDDTNPKNLTFTGYGSYGFPGDEGSHWVFTVYLSNNSPIINYVPIPGFIYFYRAKNLMGMIGIPFAAIVWTPAEKWTYSFSAFGPSVNTELVYGVKESFQPLVGFNWAQQSFMRARRIEDDHRLFFLEKKLFLGLRSPLSEKLSAELLGGYVFDRFIREGPRLDQDDGGETSLKNSWFASWNFRYLF